MQSVCNSQNCRIRNLRNWQKVTEIGKKRENRNLRIGKLRWENAGKWKSSAVLAEVGKMADGRLLHWIYGELAFFARYTHSNAT